MTTLLIRMRRVMIRSWILSIVLLVSPLVLAEPASEVAWTLELLNRVKKGDAKAGEVLANSCAGCHGSIGVSSNPEIPSLAGQLATYTYKQLMDYQQGKRSNRMMNPVAKNLKQQDMINVATWYASLVPARHESINQGKGLLHAQKLFFKGDGKRTIPPCFVCHGSHGQGEKMDIPALAGQQSDYLRNTMMAYKQGERHNDIYSRMRLIANQLSEQEIDELSRYYQQLK